MRQIRINVSGQFQFALRVSQDEPLPEVAARAHEAMKLSDNLVARFSTGQIDFVPRPS